MPDDAASRGLANGRLNLEQQKKRAKELLRALHAGDPGAEARLRAAHPHGGNLPAREAQLADTQLVVARECGFDSWPKLKGHAEALTAARAAARRPELAPDTPQTLHLRCGSDIRGALSRAGFVGAFQTFSDPFCQGPVRDEPREAFLSARAAFIGQAYHLYPDNVLRRLQEEYSALDDLERYERVVLWFEHDSFDQLILAFLLKTLGARPGLELICADRIPGVTSFVGLGQLAPEVIRLLWAARGPVAAEHVALGERVWSGLVAPSPMPLFEIASGGTRAVPAMAAALLRHLKELPSIRNGLSLTEQLTLDLLAERGPMTAQRLFGALNREREPLSFLGDAMFWAVLAGLASGARPLIAAPPGADNHQRTWPGRRISLTSRGAEVRSGAADWLADAPMRWLGGVEIKRGAPGWRWDDQAGAPVLTAEPRS